MITHPEATPGTEAAAPTEPSEFAPEPLTVTLAPDTAELVRKAAAVFGRTFGEIVDCAIADCVPQALEEDARHEYGNQATAFYLILAERFTAGKRAGIDEMPPAVKKAAPYAEPVEKDQPLNCRQLAAALGHSPSYVSALRAAGYVFELGTRTTLRHAMKWLRANPSFRATGYYRTPKRGNPGRPKRAHASAL